MKVSTRHEFNLMCYQIFIDSSRDIKVFLTVPKTKLFIKVETPYIEFPTFSYTSCVSTSCRYLQYFFIAKRLQQLRFTYIFYPLTLHSIHQHVIALGFYCGPQSQSTMRQFTKSKDFIIFIKNNRKSISTRHLDSSIMWSEIQNFIYW